jgi:DNA-binding MarR family transcriptional regulator
VASRTRHPERSVLLELGIASALVNQLFVRELERRGLRRVHVGVLRLIHIHGPITPTALELESGQAGSTLRDWLRGLLDAGFVVRLPNEADGRSHFLDTTPAGDEFMLATIPATRALEAALERELGGSLEEYRGPLERLLRAAQAALVAQEPDVKRGLSTAGPR